MINNSMKEFEFNSENQFENYAYKKLDLTILFSLVLKINKFQISLEIEIWKSNL